VRQSDAAFSRRKRIYADWTNLYAYPASIAFTGRNVTIQTDRDRATQSNSDTGGGSFMSQDSSNQSSKQSPRQLLHLVFGGELLDIGGTDFRDLDKIDVVGLFPDYKSAYAAWKAKAQATVDDAQTRYFIAHLHRLLDPATDG
jgi:hypothetical protein